MHCNIPAPIEYVRPIQQQERVKIFPNLNAPKVRFDSFINKVKNNEISIVKLQSNNKYLDFTECNGNDGRVYLPINYDTITLLLSNNVYIDIVDSFQHPRIFDVFITIMQILIIQQLSKNKNDIINSFLANVFSIDGFHTNDIISIIANSDSDI
ncbi:hypothetical protein EBV26_19040, partial [bacterium]|nr:hypothetical protein [bacterium]